MKKIILLIIIILAGCAKYSKSELAKDEAFPQSCRLAMECLYYQQDTDKGACSPMMDACKKNLIFDACKKLEDEYQKTPGKNYYITVTASDYYLNESDFAIELIVPIDPLPTTSTTTTTSSGSTTISSSTTTSTSPMLYPSW